MSRDPLVPSGYDIGMILNDICLTLTVREVDLIRTNVLLRFQELAGLAAQKPDLAPLADEYRALMQKVERAISEQEGPDAG